MEGWKDERIFLTLALMLLAWLPTGSDSSPIEQNQMDTMAFTDQLEDLTLSDWVDDADEILAQLIHNYQHMPSEDRPKLRHAFMDRYERYNEDDVHVGTKRGTKKDGQRRGGGSNRRGSTRPSAGMHATVGFGKRDGTSAEPYRPKPMLTWRH